MSNTNHNLRFAARFPVTAYVFLQIGFWVVANLFLAILIHFVFLLTKTVYDIPTPGALLQTLVLATILGILYGTTYGFVDYHFENEFFKRKPLGKIILLKTIVSLGMFMLLFALMRFALFDLIIAPAMTGKVSPLTDASWKILFNLFLVFYLLTGLIINFTNQVNRKFGPGVLLPLLLGKYRNPKEEERIFMFMDLKSSTSIAETLGHLKYSGFIRDSFNDINHRLLPFNAQVYQYVGDEIVLTWDVKHGLKDLACIEFFFACTLQFEERKAYYLKNYGQVPEFKAGLHIGKVTAVEIGDIKRDIAYHGDTLNTTARIQSVCNEYGKKFLVSEYLLTKIALPAAYSSRSLGNILLKGKAAPVGIASVEYGKELAFSA